MLEELEEDWRDVIDAPHQYSRDMSEVKGMLQDMSKNLSAMMTCLKTFIAGQEQATIGHVECSPSLPSHVSGPEPPRARVVATHCSLNNSAQQLQTAEQDLNMSSSSFPDCGPNLRSVSTASEGIRPRAQLAAERTSLSLIPLNSSINLNMQSFNKKPDENSKEFQAWIEELKNVCANKNLEEKEKLTTLWRLADALSKRRIRQYIANSETVYFDKLCEYLVSTATRSSSNEKRRHRKVKKTVKLNQLPGISFAQRFEKVVLGLESAKRLPESVRCRESATNSARPSRKRRAPGEWWRA